MTAAPLTIRFATDHSAAKAGMQDLAASVLANMIKVSDSLHIGIQANGGYAASAKLLAQNVGKDFLSVANAGVAAAANSNLSAVAISAAVGKAAAETKTAGAVMTGAHAAAAAQASFTYAIIRNEASATARLLATSPLVVGSVVGLTVAVAAFKLVSAAVDQANAQIETFIKLGDEATAAGVSVEFWQRFMEGAKAAKISVEEVQAALKGAGKAVTPRFEEQDPIRKRLQELFESGYLGDFQSKGLADYDAAGSNDGRIQATVKAMQELRDLGNQVAAIDLAERLFGADFADKIRQGKLEIDDIARNLERQRDDLIKSEEVDQAREFRDRLDEAYRKIDEALHVSVSLAAAGRDVLNVWLAIVQATASAATVAGTFLDRMAAAAKAARDAQPPSALQSPLASRTPEEGEGSLAADLGAAAGRSARGRTLYPAPVGPERPEMTITEPPAPPRRPLDFYLNPDRAGSGGAGGRGRSAGGSGDSIDAVESLINGLEKTAAAVKAETEAFGKSNAEKASAIALAKLKETADQSGITVTEAQTARVRAATEATARYKDQLQDLEQAERQLADMQRWLWNGIGDGIADAIIQGRAFKDILHDLGSMGLRASISALLTGQGPLAGVLGTAPAASAGGSAVGGIAGFVGSLLTGARANGGPVRAGGLYMVNELGQELFSPDRDGRIIPASGRWGGGGGGPTIRQGDVVIHAPGADAAALAQLRGYVDAGRAEDRRSIGQALAAWRENN